MLEIGGKCKWLSGSWWPFTWSDLDVYAMAKKHSFKPRAHFLPQISSSVHGWW